MRLLTAANFEARLRKRAAHLLTPRLPRESRSRRQEGSFHVASDDGVFANEIERMELQSQLAHYIDGECADEP